MQRPWGKSVLGLFQEEQECQSGKRRRWGEAGNEGREAVRSQILPCFVSDCQGLGFYSAKMGSHGRALSKSSELIYVLRRTLLLMLC